MNSLTRRDLLGPAPVGAFSLAAGLFLPAGAEPTPATKDEHGYEETVLGNGDPGIQPVGAFAATSTDILGPFYVERAPYRGKLTRPLEPGKPLVVRGRVWSYATKKPVSGVVLDLWQCDASGVYDVVVEKGKPNRGGFSTSGRVITDETGYYEYETVKPIPYKAGDRYRPAHIHYMLRAPGHKKLITQLYFKGDPHISSDRTASKSQLVVEPESVKGKGGGYLRSAFDIVLERE